MATQTQNLTTQEVAMAVAIAAEQTYPDEKALGKKLVEIVQRLAPSQVAEFTYRADQVRRAFVEAVKTGETRIKDEHILVLGGEWIDPAIGEILVWGGALGDLECKDPEGLRAALIAAGADTAAVDRAVYPVLKVNFVEVKKIASLRKELQDLVDDFVQRRPFGPPHLKPKEK